jgi:hypothetical protein
MSIADISIVKNRLNVVGTGSDVDIQAVIDGVEDWVQHQYLQREVLVKSTSTPIVEYQDGWEPWNTWGQVWGGRISVLYTKEWPITGTDVQSIYVNDSLIPKRLTPNDQGWVVDENGRGRILIAGYPMTEGAQNIQITYTPGYSTTTAIPQSLVEGIYQLAVAIYNRRGLEGFQSSRVGNVMLNMRDANAAGEIGNALRLLSYHRRI